MQIIILGAGISGLATAWHLKQLLGSRADVKVVEKSDRAGGWIQTVQSGEYLFEQGPRSCRTKGGGYETLALIEALGLQDQVIVPPAEASQRYLYTTKGLMRMPRHIWEIPFNPLTKGWLSALWKDWRSEKREEEDESIHSFFSRRIGSEWTDRLIDPFVTGIYAGNAARLSIKSCFPLFDEWEQRTGSLIRGAWRHKKRSYPTSPFIQHISSYPFFSFKTGMETLPRTLAGELEDDITFGNSAKKLTCHSSGIEVVLEDGQHLKGDYLISTLPTYALAALIPSCATLFKQVPYATVVSVNLGYDQAVLPMKGFGYLIPSKMKEKVLGCIWDSCVFPQQSQSADMTRMTVMMGGSRHPDYEQMSDGEAVNIALEAMQRHLAIRVEPSTVQVTRAKQAIPQFEVGHHCWKEQLQNTVRQFSPRITLSGTAMTGVSINDCIAHARRLAEELSVKI